MTCQMKCGSRWQLLLLIQSMGWTAAWLASLMWRTCCWKLPGRPTLTWRMTLRQMQTCLRYLTVPSCSGYLTNLHEVASRRIAKRPMPT